MGTSQTVAQYLMRGKGKEMRQWQKGYEWSDTDGDFNVLAPGLFTQATAAHPPGGDVFRCRAKRSF